MIPKSKILSPWKRLEGIPPRNEDVLFMTEKGAVVIRPSVVDTGHFSLWNTYVNGAKTLAWMEIPPCFKKKK